MEKRERHSQDAPFFVVGCPRSGTSLVAQLLDNHPRLAVYHETQFYPVFRPHLRYYGDLRRSGNARRLVADLREWLLLQGVTPPDPDELVAPDFEGVLSALLAAHARQEGKRRGGDKTPEHHRFLGEIRAGLPDSPVVFVVRDPRDTVRSFCKAFGASTIDGARAWNRAYESYRLHRDQVHLVRYEELVGDPDRVLAEICELLGEVYDPVMLEFFAHVPERLRSLPNAERLASPISTGSVGSFRDMPDAEVALVEQQCATGMLDLGYEPTGAQAPGSSPPRPSSFLVERLRYYWGRPDRVRFGWFRWKILLRGRLRHAVRRLGGR